jgi:hypothetical protein
MKFGIIKALIEKKLCKTLFLGRNSLDFENF